MNSSKNEDVILFCDSSCRLINKRTQCRVGPHSESEYETSFCGPSPDTCTRVEDLNRSICHLTIPATVNRHPVLSDSEKNHLITQRPEYVY